MSFRRNDTSNNNSNNNLFRDWEAIVQKEKPKNKFSI